MDIVTAKCFVTRQEEELVGMDYHELLFNGRVMLDFNILKGKYKGSALILDI